MRGGYIPAMFDECSTIYAVDKHPGKEHVTMLNFGNQCANFPTLQHDMA